MSRLLPVVHVTLAVILLSGEITILVRRGGSAERIVFFLGATSILVCYGINAPAYRFVPALNTLVFGRFIPQIAGFYPEEHLFLVSAVVLWYLVGTEMDARRRPEEFPRSKPRAPKWCETELSRSTESYSWSPRTFMTRITK